MKSHGTKKKLGFLYFLFSHEMISGAYGTLDCLVISQFKSAVCSFCTQLIINVEMLMQQLEFFYIKYCRPP
jgi:hypothetical protein